MTVSFEDLKVLQFAELIVDEIWKQTVPWDKFAREVVGAQLARAADSIGANIAEGFGRFHYGEKIQFLYYARGSLFEAKYWLNRARARNLISFDLAQDFASRLTDLARQLNSFVGNLKGRRYDEALNKKTRGIRERGTIYTVNSLGEWPDELFTEVDFDWLAAVPNP